MSNEPKRKSPQVRRANRIIQKRTFYLMLILGIGTFILLFGKLYQLQILQHEHLQELAVDQQTRSTEVTASRGSIYDRNGNIMAISATAETVFLSPKELQEELEKMEKAKQEPNEEDEDQPHWTKTELADGLAKILDISPESILKKMERTDSEYEVLKSRADEEVANQVRQFINDNHVHGVYLVTDAKRYYPYGSLACHVLGFVGDDNVGLYGLEARYESELEGKTGLVVTAKDGAGGDMPYEYERYYDAENGNDLHLTLDSTVQYYLEKGIKEMVDKFDAKNGATGVVLNAQTGAVLGMASYPNYDLNNFSAVQDTKIKTAVEKKEATLGDMQMLQWRNKALNDTYEPGSTFKVLTLSAALEEGVVDMNTTYDCTGSITVQGATIHCSGNHGHQVLKETAGNSCNPAFITYGLRLGNEKFYEYMKNFGLMDQSGIDLDGEATGIFMEPEKFSQLDLACYAFGQNFNVTPIALVAAQAACVNGGYLHQPYVVEQVQDSNGNVVYQHDDTPIRQVISEETSAEVRECLEYVVASGTGKNGQVPGYRLGGKTGTADKGQTGDIVVSFMCFAPADDPQVIMLITMDTPSRTTGTYPSGGNMVAPISGQIMSEILPYLGIEPSYSAEELLGADTTVPNVVGLSVADATAKLEQKGLGYRIEGDGEKITDQTPVGSAIIPGKSTVVLYAGETKPTAPCTVPQLQGKSPAEANTAATNAGLLIRFTGTTDSESGSVRVLSQSESAGTQVAAGTVITVQLGDTSVSD